MAKVEIVHAASPACSWSWGFEPVMNRLRLVYGKQVRLVVGQAIPHTDLAQWLEDYGMTAEEAVAFEGEIADAIGVPVRRAPSWWDLPPTALPASVAVKAAAAVHGEDGERRFQRHLMNAMFVDGRNIADDAVIADVARGLGLDLDRMLKVAGSEEADRLLAEDAHRLGHGANFYSIIVRKGKEEAQTKVVLERAFDPARVESAVDWLADGKLKKSRPKDVEAYVEDVGLASRLEIERVFGWTAREANEKLAKLERAKRLARRDVPDVGRFWTISAS